MSAKADEFGVGAGDGFPGDLRAAVADADDSHADAIVGAQYASGGESSNAGGSATNEMSA